MKIHVTGNAGAGKTTLARELGARFNLPVYSLDTVIWASGWRKRSEAERAPDIENLLNKKAWVIEGVSADVRNEADLTLWLDPPTYRCMARCIARCFRFGFKTRPELPPNCPEINILWRAIGIVWRFPRLIGHTLLHEAAANPKTVHRVRFATDAYPIISAALGPASDPDPKLD